MNGWAGWLTVCTDVCHSVSRAAESAACAEDVSGVPVPQGVVELCGVCQGRRLDAAAARLWRRSGNDEVVDEQMAILEDVTEAIDRMEVGSLGGNYVCFCMCVCGGGGTPLSTRPFAASIPPPQPSTRAVLAAVNGVIFVCTA